jgi:thiol-disulfide isomerase/thioredoxin
MEDPPNYGKYPVFSEQAILHSHDLLIEITDLTREHTVEQSNKPVAVMFYSPTCASCHQMEPYFRKYAGEYQDSVIFFNTPQYSYRPMDCRMIWGKKYSHVQIFL